MNCTIILVNWKRALDTCACISSLQLLLEANWYAVICENGSPDESASELRNFLVAKFQESVRVNSKNNNEIILDYFQRNSTNDSAPQLTLVLSKKNLGFAGGNNLAYRYVSQAVKSDYVWFLNNDTEVEPSTLGFLINRMEQDKKIGICGATLVYAHDRKTVQALGGAEYKPMFGSVSEIGSGLSWPCSVDQKAVEEQMSYVSGASMLVSSAFLDKVGLMSEDYFLYYEEIDWATRARRAGFRLGYASQAVVYHKEGAVLGSGKSPQRSTLAEYYGVRNRLVVTRKFFPWALPTVYLFSWMQVAKRVLKGHWRRARLMAAVLLGLSRSAPVGR